MSTNIDFKKLIVFCKTTNAFPLKQMTNIHKQKYINKQGSKIASPVKTLWPRCFIAPCIIITEVRTQVCTLHVTTVCELRTHSVQRYHVASRERCYSVWDTHWYIACEILWIWWYKNNIKKILWRNPQYCEEKSWANLNLIVRANRLIVQHFKETSQAYCKKYILNKKQVLKMYSILEVRMKKILQMQ